MDKRKPPYEFDSDGSSGEPGRPRRGDHDSESDLTRPQRPLTPPPPGGDTTRRSGGQGRAWDQPTTSANWDGRSQRPAGPAGGGHPPGRPSNYPTIQPRSANHPATQPPTAYQRAERGRRPAPPRSAGGYLLRGLMLAVVVAVSLSLLVIAAGLVGYGYIASQLPAPEDLQERAFTFASSQIYDRNGNRLWELMDPAAGRRTWVPLSRIAPFAQQATIATEDRFFYQNVGVDPIAVGRAVYYNLSEREIVSGGSTITQQLARNVLLPPEERAEKTFSRKLKEAVLAVELNRRYPKDKILEIYLNQIYYGNLAYGIEAASQTYFDKPASDLTLAEASLLAGLPQSPAIYDPYTNLQATKARQQVVLDLMVEAGSITPTQAAEAYQQELAFASPDFEFSAPHFVVYVRQLLEAQYGPELLYQQPGVQVQTTLDGRIQAIAEDEVANQVNALRDKNVTSGAVVVLNVKTGEILAMVGSKDFNDETIDGQVNVTLRSRQPGSAIKPLTYLAAFERGWTPSTLLMDAPVEYPDGAGGVYRPRNADDKYHGPVLLRDALGNSLNVPAVKTLQFIGVPALKEMSARLGITTLTRDDYGLSLTLGGGEVRLLELSGAYQAMANGGLRVPPVAVLRVTDSLGRVISEYHPPEGARVLRAEHAYLMTHILADNQARTQTFGPNSMLVLSRPAAVKTGTTNDYHDNWTVGYTPDIVVGVWVGNADNSAMRGISGVSGAGPIWHNVMERALEGAPVRDFIRPPGIVEMEVCADSGAQPSPLCPRRKTELFAQDQPPLGPERDMHQMVRIDISTNALASELCPPNLVEERYYQVFPPDGRQWAIEHGIAQPPAEVCPVHTGTAQAAITWPTEGQTVSDVITIQGVALAANFSHYVVEYGVSWGPQAYGPVAGPIDRLVEGGPLAEWDTRAQPNGPYQLRVVVFDRTGGVYEGRVNVLIDNAAPTPTITATPPAATETPTVQPVTDTPAPETPTETPAPEPVTETPPVEETATSEPAPDTVTPTQEAVDDNTPVPEGTPSADASATPSG